jgi:hypothetical protein
VKMAIHISKLATEFVADPLAAPSIPTGVGESVAPPGFLYILGEALNTNSENFSGAGRLRTAG